jgi:hypothetical protein
MERRLFILEVQDFDNSKDFYVVSDMMNERKARQIVANNHSDFSSDAFSTGDLEGICVYFEGRKSGNYQGGHYYIVDVIDKGLISDVELEIFKKFFKEKVIEV